MSSLFGKCACLDSRVNCKIVHWFKTCFEKLGKNLAKSAFTCNIHTILLCLLKMCMCSLLFLLARVHTTYYTSTVAHCTHYLYYTLGTGDRLAIWFARWSMRPTRLVPCSVFCSYWFSYSPCSACNYLSAGLKTMSAATLTHPGKRCWLFSRYCPPPPSLDANSRTIQSTWLLTCLLLYVVIIMLIDVCHCAAGGGDD